jgi:hypothetical protein
MKPGVILAELVAWIVFFPLAIVLALGRALGYGSKTPEQRVQTLLGWYPRDWRARHGAELAAILHDAIADGRDDLRMALDVAREGVAVRARTTTGRRVAGFFLTGLGWTMTLPQGVVAAILGQFEAIPPGWFVALHVGGDELWLVCGAMVGAGLLLVDRGVRILRPTCARAQGAG